VIDVDDFGQERFAALARVVGLHRLGKKRQLEKTELTAASVLDAIRRQVHASAYRDIRCLLDKRGRLRPIAQLTFAEAALIAGFEIIIKNAAAGDGHTDTVHKVKLRGDQARFVELAAKHFGLLTDKLEVSGDADLLERLAYGRTLLQPQTSKPTS